MDARVTDCKNRYRHSRERLLVLWGKGAWEAVLQELKDEDVRALNERERNREERAEQECLREMAKLQATDGDVMEEGENYGVILQKAVSLGEGHRTLSWIWYTGPVGESVDERVLLISSSSYMQMMTCMRRGAYCKHRAWATTIRSRVVAILSPQP